MHLAFAIASLFPSGGLQRDCLALAGLAESRGHRVTVFTADLRGDLETSATIETLDTGAITNPARDRRLGALVADRRGHFDRIVGFNKMPGLDILYCADQPYAVLKHGLSRFSPRYSAQVALEKLCFEPSARTALIVLSRLQGEAFRTIWGTPWSRMALLAPTLAPGRRRPELRDGSAVKAAVRSALAIEAAAPFWLAVAADPRTKGVDRTIAALRRHGDAVLVVAGVAPGSPRGQHLVDLASRLGVAPRLRLLGHREDVPELMAAADLLVHPARVETTGTVILEAIANGLPVIVTAVCGYAHHVAQGQAGLVCASPFDPQAFEAALDQARDSMVRQAWSGAARRYGADIALSSGLAQAVDLITGPLWGCQERCA